jgi:hypothetical protein
MRHFRHALEGFGARSSPILDEPVQTQSCRARQPSLEIIRVVPEASPEGDFGARIRS